MIYMKNLIYKCFLSCSNHLFYIGIYKKTYISIFLLDYIKVSFLIVFLFKETNQNICFFKNF